MPADALWEEVMKTAVTLSLAEARGAPVNRDLLLKWQGTERGRATRALHKLQGLAAPYWPKKLGELNPEACTGHVTELMRRHRPKLPVLKEGKEGPSYDEGVLKTYIDEGRDKHGICGAVLDLRGIRKGLSTYIEGPLSRVRQGPDDVWRLYWEFNIARARTMRNSSSNPNSQNWPKLYRECIISRHKGGLIQQSDGSQLEPRVMAHKAKCKRMLELFNDEKHRSIYLLVGQDLFGKVLDKQVDAELYLFVKTVVLATNYGASLWTLMRNAKEDGISIDEDTMKRAFTKYQKKYHEIFDFIDKTKRRVIKDQQITCMTGFVRHLPNGGSNSKGFWHIANEAVNVDIQHTASWLALMWTNIVEEIIADEKIKVELLTQVHDSNVHDVPNVKEGKKLQAASEWAIQNLPVSALIGEDLAAPLRCDTGSGPNWRVASA